jgi:hypothetical protein
MTLIATPRDTVSVRIRRRNGRLPSTIPVFSGTAVATMGSCGPQALLTLTKVRDLGPTETLYAAKAPAQKDGPAGPTRVTLLLGEEGTAVRCDLDLAGGASETVALDPKPEKAKPSSRPPASGKPAPDHDHGSDDDRGPRENVSDR